MKSGIYTKVLVLVLLSCFLYEVKCRNLLRRTHKTGSVPYVTGEGLEAYEKLKQTDEFDKIVYLIGPTAVIDIEYTDNRNWEEFANSLISNRPRYIVAKLKPNNKIVFIVWVPADAPYEMKTNYTIGLHLLKDHLDVIDEVFICNSAPILLQQINELSQK